MRGQHNVVKYREWMGGTPPQQDVLQDIDIDIDLLGTRFIPIVLAPTVSPPPLPVSNDPSTVRR